VEEDQRATSGKEIKVKGEKKKVRDALPTPVGRKFRNEDAGGAFTHGSWYAIDNPRPTSSEESQLGCISQTKKGGGTFKKKTHQQAS